MTPISSSAYPVNTYVHPIAGNLPTKKTLVSRQLQTNVHNIMVHSPLSQKILYYDVK